MKNLKNAAVVLSQTHISTFMDESDIVRTLCNSVSILLMVHLVKGGAFVSNDEDTAIISGILPILIQKFLLKKGRKKSITYTFATLRAKKEKKLSEYYAHILQRAHTVLEKEGVATIIYNTRTYTITFALL